MLPFTVVADVTVALSAMWMDPLTVDTGAAGLPAGTCTEPLTLLVESLLSEMSQPDSTRKQRAKANSGGGSSRQPAARRAMRLQCAARYLGDAHVDPLLSFWYFTPNPMSAADYTRHRH